MNNILLKIMIRCLPAICAALFLTCIDGINPYSDINKARVTITGNSIHDGDTLFVDSAYHLELAVELKEYIDSFSVNIDRTALWQDTTVQIDLMEKNPAQFSVILYDTGACDITIITYFVNKSSLSQKITVYGKEGQGDVTPPVISIESGLIMNNKIYVDTIPFKLKVRVNDTQSPVDTALLNNQRFDSTVKATSYQHVCYKTFNAGDFAVHPLQVSIFARDKAGNTATGIFSICTTSVDTFITIVRTDPDDDTVLVYQDSITVAGRVDSIINPAKFYYLFMARNDTMTGLMTIIRKSTNTWQRGSKLKKSWNRLVYYIYDTSGVSGSIPLDSNVLMVNYLDSSAGITIVRTEPLGDTAIIYKDSITVLGRVGNIQSGKPYYLFMSINGVLTGTINTVTKVSNTWQRDVPLKEAWNKLIFYVYDTNAISGKTPLTSDTLMVDYIDTVPDPVIVRTYPANDTLTLFQDTVAVLGRVDSITAGGKSYYVFMSKNGTMLGGMSTVTQAANTWIRGCKLNLSWSTMILYLYDTPTISGKTPLDADTFQMRYQDTSTADPKIISIKSGGIELEDDIILAKDTLPLTITVRKASNPILSVKVNTGTATVIAQDSLYQDTVVLLHGTSGNQIIITAEDTGGRKDQDTLTIYYDRRPRITAMPKFSAVFADSLCTDTITVVDDDLDTVSIAATLRLFGVDTIIPVNAAGIFSFRPAMKDTADSARITFKLDDGYLTIDTTVAFKVRAKVPPTLFFITREDDFPAVVDFGSDTVAVTLSTGGTTTDKRLFTVIMDSTALLWGPESTDSSFRWVPKKSNVGLHSLKVIVKAGNLGDTLYPSINVRPVQVSFKVIASSAVEGTQSHAISVAISKEFPDTGTVSFSIGAQSTAQGNDYEIQNTGTVLYFFGSVTERTINVRVIRDFRAEPDESLILNLINPSTGLVVSGIPAHTLTIRD